MAKVRTMDETFFADMGLEEVELSSGARIELPIRYLDWSAIMAHSPVPEAAVLKLSPSSRLKPVLLSPGTAVLSMVA
jgi:hypothetical protein